MDSDFIVVLDFGGAEAQSMARKLRGENVYCEVLDCGTKLDEILKGQPKGVLMAGGEADDVLRYCDPRIFECELPILAMGASAAFMVSGTGGQALGVQQKDASEQISLTDSPLFGELTGSDRFIKRVRSFELPEGFMPIAFTENGQVLAFSCEERKLYGLQFYAESNDPDGLSILSNFALTICGIEPWWDMRAFVNMQIEKMRQAVGDGEALISISGGVDSSVCAALMHKAIGERLRCIYVDTGLMRKGETELVMQAFMDEQGIELICVDAKERFLECLAGLDSPEDKREAVDRTFSEIFAEEARKYPAAACIAQGTIYPDVLASDRTERACFGVGAGLTLLEPISVLFKDEVRLAGEVLNIPAELISRQPFPRPGLAVRIIGEVTREKLDMIREADAIFRHEIADAGLDKRIWQYFALLTGDKSYGVIDGRQVYGSCVALRAVSSQDAITAMAYRLPYDLLERVAQRITGEVAGVNRVLYDITSTASASIEWE